MRNAKEIFFPTPTKSIIDAGNFGFCWRVHLFDSMKLVSYRMRSEAPLLGACCQFLSAIVMSTRFQYVLLGLWFRSDFRGKCAERYL